MPASLGILVLESTMGLTLCLVKVLYITAELFTKQSLEVDPWVSFVGLYNLWREALQISKGLVCPHPILGFPGW